MRQAQESTHKQPRIAAWLIGIFVSAIALGIGTAAAQSTNHVITNASDILALPAERAYGIKVLIRGVVTAAQPDAEWSGRFFVQDATAGVFVENISTNRIKPNQPKPGDWIEVTGISHPGGFAPIITQPVWRKLGTSPLPEAKRVPIEQLVAGLEDSQRVEISGVIRSFRSKGVVTVFEIASGGYRVEVNSIPPPEINPQTLIGAKVRVRGTASTFYNGKLRHLITVGLHVPVSSDFVVERIESSDPFTERLTPLDNLAQYRNEHELGKRVHVQGVVTFQRPGHDLFIQDTTGGMLVRSRQLDAVLPGDIVEAVGFPDYEQYLPVLQDAVFRKTKHPRQQPNTKAVTIADLHGGFRHANMITLQGKVLDTMERWVSSPRGKSLDQQTILTLQSSNHLVSVELPPTKNGDDKPAATTGSFVEITGVCLATITEDGSLQSLSVLLPSAANIRVLQEPSWWTPKRLVLGLAALLFVLVVAVSWIVMVSRRNAVLNVLIREKEEAQIGLQHANDHLEERVKERTEQLKLQITARQEAEVQFNAVLNERTRLAQELHDTLEQTLTGIALQMDTASKFATGDGTRAKHHLGLARNLVTQSQTEVRCSVWDLRSRSPEQIDLAGLLLKISNQLTDDTTLKVHVNAVGRVRPLPELIEENLLRIAQESLTNIIKHAKATQAAITVDYGPQTVSLTIQDNGVGFAADQQAGPREGHFGLLGITERVNRLRGRVVITTQPGDGTSIQVNIPIDPLAELGLNESQFGAQL